MTDDNDNVDLDSVPKSRYLDCDCDMDIDKNIDCWNCEKLLSTSDLELYPFVPFKDGELGTMSFDDRLKRRELPEVFLHKMTAQELFYQYFYCDMGLCSIGAFNSPRQGFEASKRLNMVPELLNRSDAGHTLIEILKHINLADIDEDNCAFLYLGLQLIAGQPEIINNMTDKDICDYINLQLNFLENLQTLSKTNPYYWEGGYTTAQILYGFYHILIRYEFEPFMQLLETSEGKLIFSAAEYRGFWRFHEYNAEYTRLIIDYIEKFKTKRK
jgi:hypothetical protein